MKRKSVPVLLRNSKRHGIPPTEESTIIGRWYTRIYEMKRNRKLYIGRLLRRFLLEEDGKVESIEMRCLKPKVGSGTVLEDTPHHLPDIGIFKI